MAEPLTDDQLLAIIENEEKQALGYYGSDLTDERADALKRYLGEKYGNEVEGRSQVVTRDVLETIEWCMPALLRVFLSGDEVVRFDPVGPEDMDGAALETSYINHVVTQKNNAYMVFYTWFKDAMLEKNGYVEAVWETKVEHDRESYQGLTDNEMTLLAQDEAVEVLEHEEYLDQVVDALGQPAGSVNRHNVVLRCRREYGQVSIYPVPTDEMLVSAAATGLSLRDVPFVQRRVMKTLSDIRQMGYDVPDDIGGEESQETDAQFLARRQFTEEEDVFSESLDAANKRVLLRVTYIRADKDGDGIAELRRVLIVGKTILEDEEFDAIPIYAISPNPMPHRHIGLSEADLVMDLQEIRTAIMRQFLDNLYLANNGRYAINANTVNIQDMLTSRPGGLVRVQGAPGDGIFPLVHPNTTGIAIEGMEYLDTVKENRTGVTKYNQGLDSNSLNKTATGISQIMNAASQRIEMIARHFAETGVRELFQGVHALVLKHQKDPMAYQYQGQWAQIDPREWKKRENMTVSVGLGTGNKDAQLQHLMTILQAQQFGLQIGVATPNNVYHALLKLTQNAGFKDAEAFWTNPAQQQPQPQGPPPEVQKEQIKAQAQMQAKQMDMQAEAQNARVTMAMDMQKFQAEMAQKQEQFKLELAQKWQEFLQELQMERYKADKQAEVDMMQAHMRSQDAMRSQMMGDHGRE